MVFLGVCRDQTSHSERFSAIKSDLESVPESEFSTLSVRAGTFYLCRSKWNIFRSSCSWSDHIAARVHAKLSGPGGLLDGAQWNKVGDCKLGGGAQWKPSLVVLVCPCLCTRLHPHSPPVNLNQWCKCICTHHVLRSSGRLYSHTELGMFDLISSQRLL